MRGKLILLFVFLPIVVFGQRSRPHNLSTFDNKQFHFGYSVGVNWMGFTSIPASKDTFYIDLKQHPGININLITSLRLGKYLDLRMNPGIQFSQRDLTVYEYDRIPNEDPTKLDTAYAIGQFGPKKIESVFLEVPLLIKYRSKRVNNFAPFVIAGVNPRFDLTGGEIESIWNNSSEERLIKVFDIYPELGVGMDFYTPQVKVGVELKFSVGLLNIHKKPSADPEYELYHRGVNRMMSRMVILAIHIE